MEELAGIAPSGNLRTPVQKAKNELNAARAEEQEARKDPLLSRNSHKINRMQRRTMKAFQNLQIAEKAKARKNLHNSGVLDYIIVERNNLESFTEDVMKKMAEGYILQGGVSYMQRSPPANDKSYCQALVKSKKPSKNLLENNANLLNI
jgi:hypothetical protein